jgi:hypothetical protein
VTPLPVPAATTSPPRPAARQEQQRVCAHVRVALEHARAGRTAEALREARAALVHDPNDLYSRMLVGQHLIEVDPPRGRRLLEEVLDAAARLPGESELPCAEGLSVGQLARAVRLLLTRRAAG